MIQRSEGSFRGFDQTELFFQHWTSSSTESRGGTLVITHGLGEHSEAYNRLVEGLLPGPWDIYAWDLRGHGRSEGQRGVVHSFSDYSEDLLCFLRFLSTESDLTRGPLVLLGHSMGGLVTVKRMIEGVNLKLAAMILSSPLFGITAQVPKFKQTMAEVARNWFPHLTMNTGMRYADLSRDIDIIHSYDKDPLRHDKICVALFLGFFETIDECMENAGKLQIPLLMQLAGQDRIVSTPKSEEFFERVSSMHKKKIVYPDSYHEVYNDINRMQVYADLGEFLEGFVE